MEFGCGRPGLMMRAWLMVLCLNPPVVAVGGGGGGICMSALSSDRG